MARRYRVEATLQAPDSVANADAQRDFKLVGEGSTSLEHVMSDPNVSLYCLGRDGRSVAFVETPPGVDYHAASLSYQEQRNRAVAVHELSVEEFAQGAAKIRLTGTDLLMIYSVGRCGSTLLHHMLNRVSGVRSLSEPDFFSNVQQLGLALEEQAKIRLLRDATRIMFLKSQVRSGLFALKLRSENCGLWHLMDDALDRPRSVFLYRNAVDTVRSYDRLFSIPFRQPNAWLLGMSARSSAVRTLYRQLRIVANWGQAEPKPFGRGEYSPEDVLLRVGPAGHWVLIWLVKIAAYLRAHERSGDAVFALRFEDLVGQCQATIEKMLALLGLPAEEAAACCEVLRRDAHEGTFLSRAKKLHGIDDQTVKAIVEVLESLDGIGGHPTLLPNTIQP